MTTTLDTDRALEDKCKDQFGFAGMAERLAPSIIEASKGDGIVIGLEGKWGTGKTSLLNMLRAELLATQDSSVHTITIAPWLNGDASPLVSSLLEPMAAILEKREEEVASHQGRPKKESKEKVADIARLIRDYVPKTARSAASIAKLAGYFVPAAQQVGGALGEAANFADKFIPSGPSPTEIKQQIIKAIQSLDVSFIVILDDLDRLEPEQAIEVVRLVRSVADFPKVAYLMCYDREVLAHALKVGLKVEDGDLFLQKIVQLTFNLPLPEPFDLRKQFLEEVKAIYSELNGIEASGQLLSELILAVDQEGMHLSTPREVKITLNSIKFLFPQVKSDVFFPDLCRLQLIKTTNYKLYKWLEAYLSVRSVLVTGDATVSKEEKRRMGQELKSLLPSDDVFSVRSIWHLRGFIPGLDDKEIPEERVFAKTNSSDAYEAITYKRLGSPNHYRFYFALTAPKTVMPENDFNELLDLAGNDIKKLADRLSIETAKRRHSGRTWFEHVLNRLDKDCISVLDKNQLAGIVLALSEMMDVAIKEDGAPRSLSYSLGQIANEVAKDCLKRLHELDPDILAVTVKKMADGGVALNWLVGTFFRNQLFIHGIVGDEAKPPEQREVPEDILNEAIVRLKDRISLQETKDQISGMPDISSYLYGWLNISQDEEALEWVREYCKDDYGLINILNNLRGWAMSDKVYYPLSRSAVSRFLDWDQVNERLENLEHGEFADQVADIKLAIQQSRH